MLTHLDGLWVYVDRLCTVNERSRVFFRSLPRALSLLCVPFACFGNMVSADPATIPLGDSVFDLRVDPDSFVRNDRVIPLRNVPWIRDVTEVDPDLEPSVIILQDRAAITPEGWEPVWLPDRARPFDTEDLPQELQPEGFRIARTQSQYLFLILPLHNGHLLRGLRIQSSR